MRKATTKASEEDIQYLRDNRNLPLAELAKNVDIKENTVRRYLTKFDDEDKAEKLKQLHYLFMGIKR